mmetsp:Transcript_1079/g.1607  ORF Transcript_1079/g.1607 Transcript_1079/m.1607 type:complete len:547 (-) Transcript_1079:1594-3234(-)
MGSDRNHKSTLEKLDRMDRKRFFAAPSIFRKIHSSIVSARECKKVRMQYAVRVKKEKMTGVPMRATRNGASDGVTRLYPVEFSRQNLSRAKRKVPALGNKNWTAEMDEALRNAVEKHGGKNWKQIAKEVEGRDHVQCLQRWRKCIHPDLVKGHWSKEEDVLLTRLVKESVTPELRWAEISKGIPGRTAKQCRERWSLNLDPSINKGPWTLAEDEKLLRLHKKLGNRWSELASHVEGRTENMVKGRHKSLVRAQEKLWTLEEDSVIIECKCVYKYRWLSISKKLHGRSKNAIRLRWKYLVSIDPSLDAPGRVDDQVTAEARATRVFRIAERTTPTYTPAAKRKPAAHRKVVQKQKGKVTKSPKSTVFQPEGAGVPKRNRYSLEASSSKVILPHVQKSELHQSRSEFMHASDHAPTPSNFQGKREHSFHSASPVPKRRARRETIDDALAVLSHLWYEPDKTSSGEQKSLDLAAQTAPGSLAPPDTYFLRNYPRPFTVFQSPRDAGSNPTPETHFWYFPTHTDAPPRGQLHGDGTQPPVESASSDYHQI